MKTAIQIIGRTVDTVNSTIAVCGASKSKAAIMESLSTTAVELRDAIDYLHNEQKRKFIQVRKALNAVRNVVIGMYDGVSTSDMSIGELRRANNLLATKFFPKIRDGLIAEANSQENENLDEPLRASPVAESEKRRIKIIISKSSELKEATRVLTSVRHTVGATARSSSENVNDFEALGQHTRAKFPVKVTDSVVVHVPIVPVFPNHNLDANALRQIGVKLEVIEGVNVLMDQALLVVSTSRARKNNVTPLALAHTFVEVHNERLDPKYEVVSDTPVLNPRSHDKQNGSVCFWILQRNRMAGLMRILSTSKNPALIKWGLPLPADVDKAEEEAKRVAEIQQRVHPVKHSEEKHLREVEAKRAQRMAETQKAKHGKTNKDLKATFNRANVEQKRKEAKLAEEKRTADPSKLQALVKLNKDRHEKPTPIKSGPRTAPTKPGPKTTPRSSRPRTEP